MTARAKCWGIISVGGYGSFAYRGTEAQAENMRAHKANWEQGCGRKRLATDSAEDRNMIVSERLRNRR